MPLRLHWLVLIAIPLTTGCLLPFVAKTGSPTVQAEGVNVTLGRTVEVTTRKVKLELTVVNDSDEVLVIPSDGFVIEEDGRRTLMVPVDGEVRSAGLTVYGGSTERRSFEAVAGDGDRFGVSLRRATLGGRPFTVAPLPLASPESPLTEPMAPRMQVRLRLLGGMLISQTRGNPFERPVIAPAGFAGTLEASIGFSTRWFEASVLARGGNGRVAALEAGVRPGVDWLTLLVSYGFDVVQVSDLVIGGNEVLLGHGPRLMVDVAFDVRQPRLGIDPPKRFGAFLSIGASRLSAANTPAHWTGSIEAGLRWRVF